MQGKYEIDMSKGSIVKNMLLYTLPLALSGILQLIYNAADVVIVGRFAGGNSLAAVGSTSSLINFIINVFVGLSIGVNVTMSRAIGAKDRRDMEEVSHTAVAMGFFSGLIVMAIGIVFSRMMLKIMDSPKEVIDLSTLYLRIYFLGAPGLMLYNFGSGILRAMGDTRRPLYFLTVSGVINVALNLLFVIKFKMDVAGVALATIISQYISAFCTIGCLKGSQGLLEIRKLKIHKKAFLNITRTGLPAGIQGICFSFSNIIIQTSINSFGAVAMAGSAAAGNIEGFVYIAMNAFHHGIITYNGQNIGSGNFGRIKKGLPITMGLVTVVGAVLSAVVMLLAMPLLGMYSTDIEVINYGLLRMKYIITGYFICGTMEVAAGALRGIGYSIEPMVISLLGACVFRIIWICTVFKIVPTMECLYLSYLISWIITTLAHLMLYKRCFKKLYAIYNRRKDGEYEY